MHPVPTETHSANFLTLHGWFVAGLAVPTNDIERRRDVFGSNIIPAKKPKSFLALAWEAAQDFTLLILIVAALVSLVLGFIVPKEEGAEGMYHEIFFLFFGKGHKVIFCFEVVL